MPPIETIGINKLYNDPESKLILQKFRARQFV